MQDEVSIGAASRTTGVKIPTIRFYEEIGLLPEPPRTEGNRRLYGQQHLRRLAFIRQARELGFDIDAIRTLLSLQDDPGQSCAPADSIARLRLSDVEERIRRLEALRTELARMIDDCSHGSVAECRVIEALTTAGGAVC